MCKRLIDLIAIKAVSLGACDGRHPQFRVARGRLAALVKPTVETYTVAIPWYEPDDFAQLLALAQDREEMPGDYETWRRNATAVMNTWLARGRALEIVTVRPEEFLAWLRARDLPNTAATRLRYVSEKASGDSLTER